jgi:hypothetical protein
MLQHKYFKKTYREKLTKTYLKIMIYISFREQTSAHDFQAFASLSLFFAADPYANRQLHLRRKIGFEVKPNINQVLTIRLLLGVKVVFHLQVVGKVCNYSIHFTGFM